MRLLRLTLAAFLLTLSPSKGHAMTAGDFLDRLNAQQRAAYVDGALEMLATTNGTNCGFDWWYRGPGPQQLQAVLDKHRDLLVASVLQTLVKRQCAPAQ